MNNTFSENLKKIRKDNHLSQEELAEQLGVSRQAVSKWESGAAYPEMDKIIQICDKFDLNIDDLLHRDIKEAKKEEEGKNKINKTIDEILDFITNIINLFSNMTFKSKMKCLFEQAIILIILFIVFSIIYVILYSIFDQIFYGILPNKFYYIFSGIFNSIILVLSLVAASIVFIHIFKVRYLDYYEEIKKTSKQSTTEENNLEVNTSQNENLSNELNKNNRIVFEKNNDKIIIRDPNHSEYHFMNSLFKLLLLGIKFCVLWVAFGLCVSLFVIAAIAMISFVIIKSGLLFVGVFLGLVSACVINLIFLLIVINFLFDRKNDKKKIIWAFIGSIITLGISIGIICIETLSFEFNTIEPNITNSVEIEIGEDSFISNYQGNYNLKEIAYVEEQRDNIRIEYTTYEGFELDKYNDPTGGIHLWIECRNPIKTINNFIDNINKKVFLDYSSDESKLIIYASKENIEKVQANSEKYWTVRNMIEQQEESYNEEILKLEEQIDKLTEDNEELKFAVENYKQIIDELKYQLNEE